MQIKTVLGRQEFAVVDGADGSCGWKCFPFTFPSEAAYGWNCYDMFDKLKSRVNQFECDLFKFCRIKSHRINICSLSTTMTLSVIQSLWPLSRLKLISQQCYVDI